MKRLLKITLNIAIFLAIIAFIGYIASSTYRSNSAYVEKAQEEPFVSRYKQDLSFKLPKNVNRIDLHDGKLFISAGRTVYTYSVEGELLSSFQVKEEARDITVEAGRIYVLYPTFIEVYHPGGQLLHEWEACSPLSDYCSLALAGDHLFVTDAENKNICQYTKEGNFVKFIRSPRGFVIPSYSFDIDSYNDTIYCVNSGRHLIETYTQNGDFIASFGKSGAKAGFFAGCCNPSYIAFTPDGTLLTSEKGSPRVSSFKRNGVFKEIQLNSRLLGGGSNAYKIRADENRLFVAGKNKMTVYSMK